MKSLEPGPQFRTRKLLLFFAVFAFIAIIMSYPALILCRYLMEKIRLRQEEQKFKVHLKQVFSEAKSKLSEFDLKNHPFKQHNLEPEPTPTDLSNRLLKALEPNGPRTGPGSLQFISAYRIAGVNPNEVTGCLSPMFVAAKKWSVPALKLLGRIDFTASPECCGLTVMHAWCMENPESQKELNWAVETLQYLLKNGGNIEVLTKDGKFSPLMYAVFIGCLDLARVLLAYGANPNGPPSAEANLFATPLQLAILKGDQEMFELLLESKAGILNSCSVGLNALHVAVSEGRREMLRIMIETLKRQGHKYSFDSQFPELATNREMFEEYEAGATLLHWAVLRRQRVIVEFLLYQCLVDFTIRTKKGELAIDIAERILTQDKEAGNDKICNCGEAGTCICNVENFTNYLAVKSIHDSLAARWQEFEKLEDKYGVYGNYRRLMDTMRQHSREELRRDFLMQKQAGYFSDRTTFEEAYSEFDE